MNSNRLMDWMYRRVFTPLADRRDAERDDAIAAINAKRSPAERTEAALGSKAISAGWLEIVSQRKHELLNAQRLGLAVSDESLLGTRWRELLLRLASRSQACWRCLLRAFFRLLRRKAGVQ